MPGACTPSTRLRRAQTAACLQPTALAIEPYREWVRDLLNRGRSGRLLSINPETGEIKVRASGLQFAFGAASTGNDVLVSESWRHRLLAIARQRVDQDRARPAARLSLPDRAGFGRRFLADRLHRENPADRVHPARRRLSQADDAGGAAGVLGRAAAAVGRLVPGADAGRASEDHGRGQAVGAAAVLWARDPAGVRTSRRCSPSTAASTAKTTASSRSPSSTARSTCLPRDRDGCCGYRCRRRKRRSPT